MTRPQAFEILKANFKNEAEEKDHAAIDAAFILVADIFRFLDAATVLMETKAREARSDAAAA